MYGLHFHRDANTCIYAVPLYFVTKLPRTHRHVVCPLPFTADIPSEPTQQKSSASSSEASSQLAFDCLAPSGSSLMSGKLLLLLFNAFICKYDNTVLEKIQERISIFYSFLIRVQ